MTTTEGHRAYAAKDAEVVRLVGALLASSDELLRVKLMARFDLASREEVAVLKAEVATNEARLLERVTAVYMEYDRQARAPRVDRATSASPCHHDREAVARRV